ncbi:hypothetical protein [Chitinimonas naiadis]
MNRFMVYPGQIPLETDQLNQTRFAMIALGRLAAAEFGSTNTVINGFACGPTAPATMNVSVGIGEIYSLQQVDPTAFSSLASDTGHNVMKQGILSDAVQLACPAPATAGQSINYLVEVAFQEVDGLPVTLPYYNASNPTSAWNGPNNTGVAQATVRQCLAVVQIKAGVAAVTGAQTTPAPDGGYVGAWVVTVANGAASITAANIAPYGLAPFVVPPTTLWNASSIYPGGAVAVRNGRVYVAQAATIGNAPESSPAFWQSAGLTAADTLSNILAGYTESVVVGGNATASQAINTAAANNFTYTLPQNTTFSFTGAPAGRATSFTLHVKQDATGSRAITWPGTVSWGGSAPASSTAANARDIYTFTTLDGVNWDGFQVRKGA